MRRIVSVWLSNFPLDCLRRRMRQSARLSPSCEGDPAGALETQPFALVAKEAHGVRIAALNAQASRSGLQDGMRLTDARALLPSLATRIWEPAADARELRKLAEWCQRYTPLVAIDGTAGLWLDITGAAHLHGGEACLLDDLERRLHAIGFDSRLGLAPTPGAAWAVARFSNRSAQRRIVADNALFTALHTLPLAALRLDEKELHLLGRFGLKSIGALCALPRAALKRRFPSKHLYKTVLNRLDQALGNAAEPITPLKATPAYFERLSFAEPILTTQGFECGLADLLQQLTWRLKQDNKGARRLTFSAYHADGGLSRTGIATARPSRDARHLADLFDSRIEAINPGFGVDVLVLCADVVEPLSEQQMVFSGEANDKPSQSNLDQLIDRLSNRLGEAHVQRIAYCESHIPERAEKRVPALRESAHASGRGCASGRGSASGRAAGQEGLRPPGAKPIRPSRLLRRPEPLQVMAEVPEGAPLRFTWRRVTYRVVRAEGPERIAPEWWHATDRNGARQKLDRTRDYYRVEDELGRRFWVFREGLYGREEAACQPVGQPTSQPPSLSALQPTWHMHGLFA